MAVLWRSALSDADVKTAVDGTSARKSRPERGNAGR